ncbi:TPA: hypothetical protein ACGROJ_001235 [Pseudomonas aeruginosa]|uniref:hypothetical protein n=1 Tax=Pseudomonas aeruginosa TaxID=287 RepID=UPI00106CA05D|nr:hypothetical protein [Pseudomonas aeruginosa]MCF3951872.1 hypothetical protein [Pseudomonas aeruginosa]MCS8291467.1 hypothetical protein [Pseudomonas aeruginosa]MCS9418876.1 hypothetical protein [Pseudomonas aeruginosa]HBP6099294.1 hypothetical protein [Pseudomonas aeruginosa]HDY5289078.1 hypothetical protein [Pseudomonas aeruginosa]
MGQRWINNWQTELSGPLSAGGVSLTIPAAAADLLPISAPSDFILLTLADESGSVHEVVKATAKSGGNITVARASEGVAVEWPSGSKVYAAATAGTLASIENRITILEQAAPGGGTFKAQEVNDSTPVALAPDTTIVRVSASFDGSGRELVIPLPEETEGRSLFAVFDLDVVVQPAADGVVVLSSAASGGVQLWGLIGAESWLSVSENNSRIEFVSTSGQKACFFKALVYNTGATYLYLLASGDFQ